MKARLMAVLLKGSPFYESDSSPIFYRACRNRPLYTGRAALCITQPSLSHAIDQLEKELGVPLFEKRGRNTTLTRFGEQFLHTAQNTLKTLDEGTDALRLAARGEGLIRLGLLRSLGVRFLPELAERFLAAYPEKHIRFSFYSGITYIYTYIYSQAISIWFSARLPGISRKMTV